MSTKRFDAGRAYALSPSVAVRPERFGALLYDFHSRRLTFLKTPALVRTVCELEGHGDVYGALNSAGVPASEHGQYVTALAGLAVTGTIVARDEAL